MAYCSKCGTQLSGGTNFCPKCGTPCDSSFSQSAGESGVVEQKKSSKVPIKTLLSVILIIALIGGGLFVWKSLGNDYSLDGLAKAVVNYDYIGDFHDGMALVTIEDKIGFIDMMGNEVAPCIYDFIEEEGMDCNFHDGLALVHQGEKYFFINKEGKEAFPFKYDYAKYFSDGLAVVVKGDKFGYIDTKGNEVIPLSDKYCGESFSDGLTAVFKDGKYGFVNKKGELVIPYTFEAQSEMGDASEFHEGFTIVYKDDGKPSCVDKNGKELSIGDYSFILDFNEGMAVVNKDNKYGFIDTSGKEVIPCAYEEATYFSEGYAFVKKDGKYMQIDKSGKILNTFNYESISAFHDGLARVSNKSGNETLSGFIDTKGKEVIPCIYDTWNDFSEGLVAVSKDGMNGYIDKKGYSTFDIKNEEVRQIVQQKIKEKEEKKKAEEKKKREEEEKRRKYEEEHGATGTFYSLAQNNKVWKYVNKTRFNDYIITLYFYPINRTRGNVSIVQYANNGRGGFRIFKQSKHCTYEISNDVITIGNSFGVAPYDDYDTRTLELTIVKNNDFSVELHDTDSEWAWTFYMISPEFNDPIK